ncbi:MAG: ubiquinol-cytochrome c reductase iron-sulfur subunit [Tepidiphilus sp.]|jgi:ubiquinol-cytochrome c reductase iron-sulfur subunit|uniref:Ubiquinol-cytochrome c reductase iron-sulfur subunit n=1 Tax=Tepidiphilus thermophilus TaxID=876478 RepID=A0A0K6IW56_9PROT|nr:MULTISPECIES: ubiquinol-cytochrome c reductase iron-sulfur subunit [Tepidiphilus]MBP6998410.1 ubiquinol-cytochrome c reductase iron-sulfur subunit [Tepidiphilus sp.]MDK2797136.1 ubiquinol-cytochrome c reductase iron-sulfur subunit [Tepidiphilus sp.]CUB07355.1 ubiquinol-cytochrome c reductase, iron-sulfur subunit [Tepidiphilus thermophilus]
MSKDQALDDNRRQLLIATSVVGGAGVVAAAAPFVASLTPSERAKAAGAPAEADISKLAPGEMMTVEWRGQPVWILRRTEAMLATLEEVEPQLADPTSEKSVQPPYAKNRHRSIKPEYLVVIGICTHLGCSPTAKFAKGEASGIGKDWLGGYLCPCHGSRFDLAARVFKSQPAPTNLTVPPHQYLTDTKILIGEDKA